MRARILIVIVAVLVVAVVGTGAGLLLSRGQTSAGGNAAAPVSLCSDSQSDYAIAFSPDGKTLATAAEPSSSPGESEYVDLWTVPGGTQTATLNNTDGTSGIFPSVAFSPDGKTLAISSLGDMQGVQLWDVATRRQVGDLQFQSSSISGSGYGYPAIAFSPHGKMLAAGGEVWDVADQSQVGMYGTPGNVTAVAFSPDGRTLATESGSSSQTVQIWNIAAHTQVATLHADGPVWSLAFSPDGKGLVTSSGEPDVQVWRTDTWKLATTLNAPVESMYPAVAFSPDGRTLALDTSLYTSTGFADVELWNTTSGWPWKGTAPEEPPVPDETQESEQCLAQRGADGS